MSLAVFRRMVDSSDQHRTVSIPIRSNGAYSQKSPANRPVELWRGPDQLQPHPQSVLNSPHRQSAPAEWPPSYPGLECAKHTWPKARSEEIHFVVHIGSLRPSLCPGAAATDALRSVRSTPGAQCPSAKKFISSRRPQSVVSSPHGQSAPAESPPSYPGLECAKHTWPKARSEEIDFVVLPVVTSWLTHL